MVVWTTYCDEPMMKNMAEMMPKGSIASHDIVESGERKAGAIGGKVEARGYGGVVKP